MRVVDNVAVKHKFMVFGDISEKTLEVAEEKVWGSYVQITDNNRVHFIYGRWVEVRSERLPCPA
jgi:hypothetical protein